jgi:ABC-type Fe3+/spermidine/putrescine transport system ATPase subunit
MTETPSALAGAGDHAAEAPAPGNASAESSVAIRLEGLWKTYPKAAVPAVKDLSLVVHDGEIVTLLGPSGCGKTTTLRMVAGLETVDSGSIYFGDRPIVLTDRKLSLAPDKRRLGMVFQSYAIWPNMTVEQNVAFPLRSQRYPKHEIAPRVERALALVGMAGYGKRPAPLLSGGQQQRVALARALINQPGVLLLDEPLGALDALTRLKLQNEIADLSVTNPKTVVLVTHDIEEAVFFADRIVVMDAAPGRIRKIIPVDLPRPRDRTGAEFVELRRQVLREFVEDTVHRS